MSTPHQHGALLQHAARCHIQRVAVKMWLDCPGCGVIFFPINAPGMGRFQLLNLGVLGYGLELRFWVVIGIIVSLTLTITLITTLTII